MDSQTNPAVGLAVSRPTRHTGRKLRRLPDFAEIYARLTQRIAAAPPPRRSCARTLAIAQVAMAFQHLQDTLLRVIGLHRYRFSDVPDALPADASLDLLLARLGQLAGSVDEPWCKDLQVLVEHALAARALTDHLLAFRQASAATLTQLGLTQVPQSAAEIDAFAMEVEKLDAAFFALGAEYVLDCHHRGLGLDGQALAPRGAGKAGRRKRALAVDMV